MGISFVISAARDCRLEKLCTNILSDKINVCKNVTYIHMARSCSQDGSWELMGKVFGTNTSPTPTPSSATRPWVVARSSPFANLLLSEIVGTAKSCLSSFKKFPFPSATMFKTTNGRICTHIFYKFE